MIVWVSSRGTKAVFTWFLIAIFLYYLLVCSVRTCFTHGLNVRMLHLLITDPLLGDNNKTEHSTLTKEKFLPVISWLSLPLLSRQVNERRREDKKKRKKALRNVCLAARKDHWEAAVIFSVSNTTKYPQSQRSPHPSFLHPIPWRLLLHVKSVSGSWLSSVEWERLSPISPSACGSEMHAEVMRVILWAAASLVEHATSRHFRPHTEAPRAWAAGLQATKQGQGRATATKHALTLLRGDRSNGWHSKTTLWIRMKPHSSGHFQNIIQHCSAMEWPSLCVYQIDMGAKHKPQTPSSKREWCFCLVSK